MVQTRDIFLALLLVSCTGKEKNLTFESKSSLLRQTCFCWCFAMNPLLFPPLKKKSDQDRRHLLATSARRHSFSRCDGNGTATAAN